MSGLTWTVATAGRCPSRGQDVALLPARPGSNLRNGVCRFCFLLSNLGRVKMRNEKVIRHIVTLHAPHTRTDVPATREQGFSHRVTCHQRQRAGADVLTLLWEGDALLQGTAEKVPGSLPKARGNDPSEGAGCSFACSANPLLVFTQQVALVKATGSSELLSSARQVVVSFRRLSQEAPVWAGARGSRGGLPS